MSRATPDACGVPYIDGDLHADLKKKCQGGAGNERVRPSQDLHLDFT